MYSDLGLLLLPTAVIFIWLGILTFLITENRRFFRSLFSKSGERDVRRKFEEIVTYINSSNSRFDKIKEELARLDKKGSGLISKMEMNSRPMQSSSS
jgi:hypothetical protein